MDATFLVMALIGAGAILAAWRLWPASEPDAAPHFHPGLPPDDPHLAAAPADAQGRHAHVFVIDADHPYWPRTA